MCEDIGSENKCIQKVAEMLTFDLLTHSLTCSSLSSSTVGIWRNLRSLYIQNIYSYFTRHNGLFMSKNDLDLRTGELKLYGRLHLELE